MRNPYAKSLANPLFRKKVIKPKKGKGAPYSRKKNKKVKEE